MKEVHIESISNGLGSQSMYLLIMASRGEIPARVSITADTGAENDRLWSTGERTTSLVYYQQVVEPLCKRYGIETHLVRAENKAKSPLLPLGEHTRLMISQGKLNHIKIPVFGSRGGRMKQSCTSRWKITAINQELRRLGATSARTAQGIHYGESARRVKGVYQGNINGYDTYKSLVSKKAVEPGKPQKVVKWLSHYYPLVDKRLHREELQTRLKQLDIPYLLSSECDFCPHQDAARWLRHTNESLQESAALEASMGGQFFLTDKRIPLLIAIEQMRSKVAPITPESDFGCGNSHCGV